MLGNTHFAFETPNVIDEGDLPPTPPARSSQIATPATVSTTPDEDDEEVDYQAARESAKRLLNDISDLELQQPKSSATTKIPLSQRLPFRDFPNYYPTQSSNGMYDPYKDDEKKSSYVDDDEDVYGEHSLPSSAEDARLHASMLHPPKRGGLGKTLKLSAPKLVAPKSLFHRNRSNGDPYLNNNLYDVNSMHHGKDSSQSSFRDVRDRIIHFVKHYRCSLLVLLLLLATVIAVSVTVTSHHHDSTVGSKGFAGTERYETIVQFLAAKGVSSLEDLTAHSGTRSNTPQNAAVNWIAGLDALQYDISNLRLIQRYVLAVLYFATGGQLMEEGVERAIDTPWTSTLDFLGAEDECGWSHIQAIPTYANQMVNVGASCNTELQVTSLFIPDNRLTGSLPSELAFLPKLQLLGLQNNALSGSLPDNYGSLHELLYVNLNHNGLTGTIPDYVGDWNQLVVLALEANTLNGTIPITMNTLAQLKTLSLSQNQLYGSLEFVKHLAALEYLYLAHNQFTGFIEESFFYNMANIREFDVSNNGLQGRFPIQMLLKSGTNLHTIDIAYNNFTGSFPTGILSQNFALHYLSVRNNQMTGALPTTLNQLVQLKHLDLAHNAFTGTIPNAIGRCASLEYLFLGHNQFDAVDDALPPLSGLVSLRELSLSGLGITGRIPYWLHFLDQLEMLDLSHNQFTGVIPTKIWSLPRLYYLILNNNNITGPLPTTGGTQISFLSVHNTLIHDDAFDAAVCHTGSRRLASTVTSKSSSGIKIVADCHAGCSQKCCGECCASESCAADAIAGYTDGLDFVAAPLSFDPSIINESQLNAFDMQSSDLDP
jgi:Leucine-rich repeat (LRR) protein